MSGTIQQSNKQRQFETLDEGKPPFILVDKSKKHLAKQKGKVQEKLLRQSSGNSEASSSVGIDRAAATKDRLKDILAKYIVGSITIATHKLKLHEKLGKSLAASQLFERVHKRKKGEENFVDNKSKIVCFKVSSQPDFDIYAWCEASQGLGKGGRMYGLGICRPVLDKVGTSSGSPFVPLDGNVALITLQEEFCGACEKIDDLTRENSELIRKMEDGRREEKKKSIEFKQTILRMLGQRTVRKGFMRMGGLICGASGLVIAAFAIRFDGSFSTKDTEALTIQHGLRVIANVSIQIQHVALSRA
ncbi:Uncharacterized protein Fot_03310 [Forsythia ovata]|uniref:Uncharacterized protein n=1 Tax=Forsythia ovata TaxID=205694 RepID=A0ABD1X9C8_9LAMI